VALPKVDYPKPNIHAALKSTRGRRDRCSGLRRCITKTHFSFTWSTPNSPDDLSAQGELHLQVIADRLRRRYNVHWNLPNRGAVTGETIKAKGTRSTAKKANGWPGQFAEVWMRIEPKPQSSGLELRNRCRAENVDRVFVRRWRKGMTKREEASWRATG